MESGRGRANVINLSSRLAMLAIFWYAGNNSAHIGHICAAGTLSHNKSNAVDLIGAPEIRTVKCTRPSFPAVGHDFRSFNLAHSI